MDKVKEETIIVVYCSVNACITKLTKEYIYYFI